MRMRASKFLSKSVWHRFWVGAPVLYIAILILIWTIPPIYYRIMPSTWFLDYYKTEVNNAVVGEDVPFKQCRITRAGTLRSENTHAVRTIYTSDDIQVAEYAFNPTIQDSEQECFDNVISTNRQPQVPGKYYFCTNVLFLAGGVDQEISYCSNVYEYRAQ